MLTREQCRDIAKQVKPNKLEKCVHCDKIKKHNQVLVLVNNLTGEYHFTCKECYMKMSKSL